MKRALSILFLLSVLWLPFSGLWTAHATDLSVSNNAILCWFSDSLSIDDQPPITGYKGEAYLHSYFVLNYPQFNLQFYNLSRSGQSMTDRLTNNIPVNGVPVWGYQTNNFQHIGFSLGTDAASLSSNNMFYAQSNVFKAPTFLSDGDSSLVTHAGWCSTNLVQWIGVGEPPTESSDGDLNEAARGYATTNAGWTFGIRGLESWSRLVSSWTHDTTNNSGLNIQWLDSGHVGSGGQLSWMLALLKDITTDTNISNCTLDWAGTLVSTNRCVVSGISRTGNILTFTRHDDRLPMAWDAPDGTITNEANRAFNLIPSDADFFRFTLQVTNLPAGTYSVSIDGTLMATMPDTSLAAGWNMFTNTVGPYWAQRKEVLGRIRDLELANRVTLIPGAAGLDQGTVSYMSDAAGQWAAGKRGDDLIAALNTRITQLQTNFTAIHAAAQPTNHMFTVTLAAPRFAPFHK
jgi:hypothetical protein